MLYPPKWLRCFCRSQRVYSLRLSLVLFSDCPNILLLYEAFGDYSKISVMTKIDYTTRTSTVMASFNHTCLLYHLEFNFLSRLCIQNHCCLMSPELPFLYPKYDGFRILRSDMRNEVLYIKFAPTFGDYESDLLIESIQ
jgi:hypothetical protein